MSDPARRGQWHLLTGLILGLILGLVYAWVISPVQYINTDPSALRADFKDRYRLLIARAYNANNDLPRARARLALLKEPDSASLLAAQAQRILAESGSAEDARSLALLAAALGNQPEGIPVAQNPTRTSPPDGFEITPTTAEPTTTPQPVRSLTPTLRSTATEPPPLPTLTVTPTLSSAFRYEKMEKLCTAPLPAQPLLMVEVYDKGGLPVPGVEVLVVWANGSDHFFTGLKPELGLGYGDFTMQPGVLYTVRLAIGGEPVAALAAPNCGEGVIGSLRIIFSEP